MRKLDPQRFQMAVMCLALGRAKTAVRAQILANCQKVSHFSCRELNDLREAYFALHMEELITLALADVWKLPSFARYRPTQPQPLRYDNATGETLVDIARSYAVSYSTISRLEATI